MAPDPILSGWDVVLLMAPFGVMLIAWMFRLDEVLASPRSRRRGRVFSTSEIRGRTAMTDPDGVPWRRLADGSGRSASKVRTVENPRTRPVHRVPLLPISQYKSF